MKHIPNILTLCNLFCGALGIILAFNDQMFLNSDKQIIISAGTQVFYAGLCLIIAAVFDFADGFVARLLNAQSPIGKDLDSLADVVSFGVLPAVLAYRLLSMAHYKEVYSFETSMITAVPALLLAVFAALRLAIFNNDENQKEIFIGLPTPAMGLFWAGLAMAVQLQPHYANFLLNQWTLYGFVIFFSYMMVSHWEMFSLKFKNLNFKQNVLPYSLLLIGVILLLLLKFIAIPILILLYIFICIINNFISTSK